MKQPRASLKDPTPSLRLGAFSVLLWLLAVPLVAAQYEWTGSSGSDLFWATPANWSPAGPPEAADDARFFDPGAAGDNATVNNTVATSRSVQSLWFGQTNGFHKTLINPGTTLTISGTNAGNALLVGTETDNGSVQSVDAKIAGPGAALAVLNPTANLAVRQAGANGGSTLRATLDLSELDLFTAAVGRVLIGSESPVAPRPAGSLYLARTNALTTSGTAPTLGIGGRGGNNNGGQPSFLYLGQQNTIFANSIIVGRGKQGGGSGGSQILFNTAVFSNPEAVFRGADGTNRIASWSMADSEAVGGTVNTRGSCNFAGGKLDALVDVMFVGRSSTGTGAGTPEGFFTFDQGLLDVNTLRVGYQSISGANGARGTFNVNGTAALRVNTVLELAHVSGGAGGTLVEGTLNINGGSVWAQAVTTTSGNLTSAINVSGGTLALASLAGTPETPLSALTLGDAVLELAPLDHATNIVVATLTTASTTNNTINISSLPVITGYPVRYTLISYAVPATFDFALGTLPAGTPSFQGYLSNNVDNSTIDLVITGGPAPLQSLTWKGSPTGDWDTTTANWLVSGLPGVYRQNDSVTFDDTATGTTTVNFTTALTPHTLTVNNTTKSYTFTGTGSLSGAISLDKQGSGTLVLQNSGVNDFTGGVSISGGKLQLGGGADRLPVGSAVILADQAGATLDLNNVDQTIASLSGGGAGGGNVALGSGTLTITAGGGDHAGTISGSGMLVKTNAGIQVLSGANLYSGGTLVTGGRLSVANATGSGTGSGSVQVETNATVAIGAGGPGGSIATSHITNYGTVRLDRSDDFTLANAIVGWGSLSKVNTNTALIPVSNTYTGLTTISDGALRVNHPEALGDTIGQTTIANTPGARLELIGGVTLPEPMLLNQKQSAAGLAPCIVNVSGTNTLTGQINATTGGSYWTLRTDEGKLVVSGVFSNLTTSGNRGLRLVGEAEGDWQTDFGNNASGTAVNSLFKDNGGTWTLSGDNTYNGGTTVAAGRLLVNGSIQNSTGVSVSGGTLGGTGVIKSPVTIEGGGTLAPGTSIGTLTINNALTLNGTTEMEVSRSSADKVAGLTGVTFGGTLRIMLVGALNGTEVFKLFDAPLGTFAGDFSYELPQLDAPLAWDTSSMLVDGTLRVTGGVEPPQIGMAMRTGDGNFQLTGTGPANAAYRILATTNVALPLSSWLQISSGSFTGGSFTFTDLNATNFPRRFYSVVTP